MAKELKLTPELRAKLMGYSVATGTVSYSPTMDGIPKEYVPVFKIRNLTNKEYNDIKKLQAITDQYELEDKMLNIIKSCIVGWSNFVDLSTDEYIEFIADDKGVITDDMFHLIPLTIKTGIFAHIMKINGVGV